MGPKPHSLFDGDRCVGLNPDLCAAGQRLVWAVNQLRLTMDGHFMTVCVGASLFDRDHWVALSSLAIGTNDVLVDVDALQTIRH